MRANLAGWILPAAVILMSGCGSQTPRPETAAASTAVQTVRAIMEQWPDTYEAVGTVRARTSAAIAAKVMAYVRDVSVQSGDHVSQDALLATLDARDLDANWRRAQAARDEAQAAQDETSQSLTAAQAQLDLASATFARIRELFDKKSVSNQEFDEALARHKAAQAAYQMAAAKGAQVHAKIAQAEQEVQSAAILRGYAEVRAPFAGVVTTRIAEPGSMAVPGSPLFTIERQGAYRLEASVDESHSPAPRPGQPVTVILEGLDHSLAARVSEIAPDVDPAARSYLVKIDLPALPQLRSGMFGRAVFSGAATSVLSVPLTAVAVRGQLQSVMVADAGYARARLVTLGRKSGAQIEILSGLSAGETLVCPLPPALADGARIEVRP